MYNVPVRLKRSTQSIVQKEWRNNFLTTLILQNTNAQRQGKDSFFFSQAGMKQTVSKNQ